MRWRVESWHLSAELPPNYLADINPLIKPDKELERSILNLYKSAHNNTESRFGYLDLRLKKWKVRQIMLEKRVCFLSFGWNRS